jgi:hypothetical protein
LCSADQCRCWCVLVRSVRSRNIVVCADSASSEISRLLCCRLFVCFAVAVAVPALDTGNWIFLRLIQVRQSVCTKETRSVHSATRCSEKLMSSVGFLRDRQTSGGPETGQLSTGVSEVIAYLTNSHSKLSIASCCND